jgi:hypothetical protein
VFINYGEKGNSDLLLLYGFALDRYGRNPKPLIVCTYYLFSTFTYFVCFCCVTTLFLYINVYLSAHNVVLSLVRNPFDAVDISVGLSVEDPLYNQKRVYLDKSGRGATSVRFPLQRNRYNRVMIIMIIYIDHNHELLSIQLSLSSHAVE